MHDLLRLRAYAILLAFVLDLLLGDPHTRLHPIALIGRGTAALEKRSRAFFPRGKKGERRAGFVTWIITVSLALALPLLFLILTWRYARPVFFVADTLLCWLMLAARSLQKESMKVYGELKKGDLMGARRALSGIVGRDTDCLDAEQVTKAVVETVAENTSDGVTAPLCYMALGGSPLAMLYKAVNTMDSMFGYTNERYRHFGYFPAKIDDVFNFLPARLTGLLMIPAACLAGLSARGAAHIFWRDRKNHPSPNSACGEAAAAGALGLQLGGDMMYFGEWHRKKTIGDAGRRAEAGDILKVIRLMYAAAIETLVLLLLILLLF